MLHRNFRHEKESWMDLIERLQAAPDPSELTRHLEWFSRVRRDTGGPGEKAAAEYIQSTLDAAGIPVRMHRFKAFLSYPRTARLRVPTAPGFTPECVTHSFTRSTPEGGVVGTLVRA